MSEPTVIDLILGYLREDSDQVEVLTEGRFTVPFSQYRILGTPAGMIYEAGLLTDGGEVEWTPLFVFGATPDGFSLASMAQRETN